MFKAKLIKKWELSVAVALIMTIVFSFVSFNAECKEIRSDVLRLHILANSNSDKDQMLKLKVRDRILKDTEAVFNKSGSIDEAVLLAKINIDAIKESALNEIKLNGYNYPVKVEIAKSYFETRHYDDYTLPAGEYEAVRVLIGNATGKNWWCVMYPGLCLSCADDNQYNKALNKNELDIIENYPKYEIRFKTVEIFESLMNMIK